MKRPKMPPCHQHARHWFAYRGLRGGVGTSSPVCVRYGCDVPNPNYDPDRDPYRKDLND